VQVDLVWDPPWTLESLPEAARLALGLDAGPKFQPRARPRAGDNVIR